MVGRQIIMEEETGVEMYQYIMVVVIQIIMVTIMDMVTIITTV